MIPHFYGKEADRFGAYSENGADKAPFFRRCAPMKRLLHITNRFLFTESGTGMRVSLAKRHVSGNAERFYLRTGSFARNMTIELTVWLLFVIMTKKTKMDK